MLAPAYGLDPNGGGFMGPGGGGGGGDPYKTAVVDTLVSRVQGREYFPKAGKPLS